MPDIMELTVEEQALLDADRADKTPVVQEERPEADKSDLKQPKATKSDQKPAESAADEIPAAEEHPQTVPYSALAEERTRRKEAEKQARAEREQMQRLAGRLDALNEVLSPKQQPAAKPTVQEQPIEVLTDVASRLDAMEQQRQHEAQWGQFNAALQNATREFEATTPDFNHAIQHLEAARVRELQAIGLPAERIQAVIQQEAVQISGLAFEQGRNPAEIFYKLAQERGYQKAAKNPANPANPAQTPLRGLNGQFQAQAAAEKLATIAKGQEGAGRSLGGAGGANSGELTLEALAAMDDEDFAALKDSAWRKMWN